MIENKNRAYSGTISIFLMIVFLSLMTFVMTIVEVTRYQIMVVQSFRDVLYASESILGAYDQQLKNEYGIFARKPSYSDVAFTEYADRYKGSPISNDLSYYLEGVLSPDKERFTYTFLDAYLLRREIEPLRINEARLQSVQVNESKVLGDDLKYIKAEMVAYTKARLPLMATDHVLKALGSASKLSKSATLLQEKQEQMAQAVSIESLFLELYEVLDGVKVNTKTGGLERLNATYVNQIGSKQATQTYLPLATQPSTTTDIGYLTQNCLNLTTGLKTRISELTRSYASYQNALNVYQNIEGAIKHKELLLEELDTRLSTIDFQIATISIALKVAKEDRLTTLEEELDTLKVEFNTISEEMSQVHRLIEDLEEDQVGLLDQMQHTKTEMTAITVSITGLMASLVGEEQHFALTFDQGTGIGAKNQKAIAITREIEARGHNLTESIDKFLVHHELEKASYLTATYESTRAELSQLRDAYGPDKSSDYRQEGNLIYIRERAASNLDILDDIQEATQMITDESSKKLLASLLLAEGFNRATIFSLKSLVGEDVFIAFYPYFRDYLGSSLSLGDYQGALVIIRQAMKEYHLIEAMDYTNQTEEKVAVTQAYKSEPSAFVDFIGDLKSLAQVVGIDQLLKGLPVSDYPLMAERYSLNGGYVKGPLVYDYETLYDEADYQGTSSQEVEGDAQVLNVTKEIGGLDGLLDGVEEQILLSEYAVGMFRSVADQYEANPETLAGYPKLAHPFGAELEYIYTGIENPEAAVNRVAAQILGLRIGMNVIHLSTNAAKRMTITSISNTLAGWWTAGIGTLLLALVIGLIWAVAESLLDVSMLLRGEKVPLLKTSATWVTGPGGGMTMIIDGLAEGGMAVVTNMSEGLQAKMEAFNANVSEDISSQVKETAESAIGELYESAKGETDYLIDHLEMTFYEAVNEAIYAYENGLSKPSADDFFSKNDMGYDVLDEMLKQLYRTLDQNLEPSYAQLIDIKNDLLGQYEMRMSRLYDTIRNQMESLVDDQIGLLTDTINSKGKEAIQKGESYLLGVIENEKQTMTASLHGQVLNQLPGPTKELGQKDMGVYLPKIDYETYIRLLMMADYKNIDQRVARMVDLVDLNLAFAATYPGFDGSGQATKEMVMSPTFRPMAHDYIIGYTGRIGFSIPYLFVNLSVFRQNESDRAYTIFHQVERQYE